MSDDVTIEPEEGEGEATPEQKLKKLRDELKKIQKEAADNLAGWQRAKADYVNLERRMRLSGEEAGKSAARAIILSFIPAIDSLEAASGADKGLQAILRQADEAFKASGITRFAPKVGEPFDPMQHESVQTLATAKKDEDNTISECLQSGYKMGDSVIRPARVIIKHHE